MREVFILTIFLSLIIGCSKGPDQTLDIIPVPPQRDSLKPDSVTNSKPASLYIYEGLVFSAHSLFDQNQYFSTFDTSFKTPKPRNKLDSNQLRNVDIIYIHDYDYMEPGFMDPITASKRWYWDGPIYHFPWLANSKKVEFFKTELTEDHFKKAKADPTLLTAYFKDTVRTEHHIFPPGSCIGGRIYNSLQSQQVWALKFEGGKRGLLFILKNQDSGWPIFASTGWRTRIDIIREK